MEPEADRSLEGARRAAADHDLAGWVSRFLASPGSDNPGLGAVLSEKLGWWVGPIRLPIDRLQRLAGPPGDPVLCPVDEDYWDTRVDRMEELAKGGWEPPPVVCTYRPDELVLEDGNHRVESLRQAGKDSVWAVVGFERPEDRDRFAEEWIETNEDLPSS